MEEQVDDLSTCRKCGKIKLRRQDGYFPDGRNKRFVNDDGEQWNGRKCPDCQKSNSKTHIKQKRADAKTRSDA